MINMSLKYIIKLNGCYNKICLIIEKQNKIAIQLTSFVFPELFECTNNHN